MHVAMKAKTSQSKSNIKDLPTHLLPPPPPPNQQTHNTLQQITKIIQDIMKPETINEILESLKIITTKITKINQTIAAATTETQKAVKQQNHDIVCKC